MVVLGANPHCEQMCKTGAGSGFVGRKSLVTIYTIFLYKNSMKMLQDRQIEVHKIYKSFGFIILIEDIYK